LTAHHTKFAERVMCGRFAHRKPEVSLAAAAKATDVLIILINLGTAVSYILILSSSSVDLWQVRATRGRVVPPHPARTAPSRVARTARVTVHGAPRAIRRMELAQEWVPSHPIRPAGFWLTERQIAVVFFAAVPPPTLNLCATECSDSR
jgi:hypothetical protein